MWQKVGLLGRDKLLMNEVRPKLREKRGFVLTGQHGVGKTALLEWCKKHIPDNVSFVSASWTIKEILQHICIDWQVEILDDNGAVLPKSKWQVLDMYNAILALSGNWLIIDDIHQAAPAMIRKLKPFRDRFVFICAGILPFRKDELKRLLYGLKYVDVKPIENKDMFRIAEISAPLLKTDIPISDAVHAARGIPAYLFNIFNGEVTPEAIRTDIEEIDISPVLMIGLVFVMALRYIAKGYEDSTGMVMTGGLGMAVALIFRFYLFKGMRK
jgi:hypothetical protein